MKAKRYNIVIAADFDDEIEESEVADRIMQALRHPSVPVGVARVASAPVVPLSKPQLYALN